jgi:LacI family transcriptional regulator
MVSLKDVARELDLSVGLVSKVLSGRMGTTGVSAEKRDRIITMAKAKGFVPNRTARALRSGRVGTVGVFLHPLGERGTDLSENILHGIADGLASSSYHLWLTFFERDTDFHRTMDASNIRRQADALIVAGVSHPELIPRLKELDHDVLPVVISEEELSPEQLTNICVDTHRQGRLPTEHLIARGCRRIAEISHKKKRHLGYLDAMKDAVLSTQGLIAEVNGFKVIDGRMGVRQLLDKGIDFDGLVCHSDHQALGAIQELVARGIRVPDQVRVTGVDDSALCEVSPVPLTSITAEGHSIGLATVEAVLQKLDGKQAASRLIQPRLIQRDST